MNTLIGKKTFERKGKGAGIFFKYKGKKMNNNIKTIQPADDEMFEVAYLQGQ